MRFFFSKEQRGLAGSSLAPRLMHARFLFGPTETQTTLLCVVSSGVAVVAVLWWRKAATALVQDTQGGRAGVAREISGAGHTVKHRT